MATQRLLWVEHASGKVTRRPDAELVTLPVTAISSVVGMNVMVNDATNRTWLAILLAMMLALSLVLRWARRQGWW